MVWEMLVPPIADMTTSFTSDTLRPSRAASARLMETSM
jgi:hypothetical protein